MLTIKKDNLFFQVGKIDEENEIYIRLQDTIIYLDVNLMQLIADHILEQIKESKIKP